MAEGASGADALRLVERHRPDVLVLDVNLPDLNGLEVAQRLRARGTTTAILVLTIHDFYIEAIAGRWEGGEVWERAV